LVAQCITIVKQQAKKLLGGPQRSLTVFQVVQGKKVWKLLDCQVFICVWLLD
jgi:hypothetical protein